MPKHKYIIDFEIIWKKINDSLSPEEDLLLNQWLEEKEEHRTYFENVIKYYEGGSSFDKNPPNVNKDWHQVSAQFADTKQIRRRKIVQFGTALTAAVTLIGLVFYLFDFNKKDLPIVDAPEIIVPGEFKAILILDDGEQFNLNEDEQFNIESGGAEIKSEGTSLSYISKSTGSKEFNTLKTPRGGEFFLELSDGTKIWVNAETTLKYPVQFAENERKVELNGEAYFQVASDTARPFQVVSGDQSIRVLGTSFNVTSYKNDDFIITTLVEGKVEVYPTYAPENAQILLPNHQSIMNKRTGELLQNAVNPNQFTAWKTGRFHFREDPLNDIMKVLSRWYDIEVFFENSDAANIKFTGGFKRYEKFENVRALIEKTEEVNFMIKGKTVIIK